MTNDVKIYRAALYMRLSRDDGSQESESIGTQRKMLENYAAEHGFSVFAEYADDGWSGTNFDRPAWQHMIADIEMGKVNLVLTKDLSRLGRNYITAGQYTEIYFPAHGVRYIAVNDGYDSASACTDIAPFKNVVNELYARDISRKIRSAFHTKMEEGAYIGNFAPYGYQKDPSDKNHLLPNPEPAGIVKKIFQQAATGKGPAQLAAWLNSCGVATPSVYRHSGCLYVQKPSVQWTSSSVCKLLANQVYLGKIVQGKTTKFSFKSKQTLRNPPDAWLTVEHKHEPLITQELFDCVHHRCVARKSPANGTFHNVFAGLVVCADCGHAMSPSGGKSVTLACGRYKLLGRSACSNHFISYDALQQVVLQELQTLLSLSAREEEQVRQQLIQNSTREQQSIEQELQRLTRHAAELESMIYRLYEDHSAGRLEERLFVQMLANCEAQRHAVFSKQQALQKAVAVPKQLPNLRTLELPLSAVLLRQFVKRIEVEQGSYDSENHHGHKCQKVRIFYRFSAYKSEQRH